MASASTRRLLTGPVWASSSEGATNRQNPEALGLTRAVGYDLKFQQEGTGFYPSRRLTNQRYHEWDLGFGHKMLIGIPEWDDGVNYRQHAFASVDGVPYVALVANGPAVGNATDPTDSPNAVWRAY